MQNEKPFNHRNTWQIVAGSLLGILAIYLVLRGVSLAQLWETLGQANPWLTLAALILALFNVAVFSARWWVTLSLEWRTQEYLSMLAGVFLGQMFNILLPARIGELARIYFVGERLDVPKSKLLGTLVIEKVADMVVFGVGVLLLLLMISLPGWVFEPGQAIVVVALVALIGIVVVMIWGQSLLNWMRPWLEKLPSRWGGRLASMFEQALSGLDSLRSWRRQLMIWATSFAVLVLSTLTNYILLLALDVRVPFSAALFVLVVLQVGSVPPSSPGKLGVYHYLAVLALSAFAVEKDLGLAYGVLLYVVALLSKVIIGVGVLIVTRWRIPRFTSNSQR